MLGLLDRIILRKGGRENEYIGRNRSKEILWRRT